MRELKFRAWDSKDNNWLFDSPDGFSMFGEMVIMGEWGAAAWRSIVDDMPNRFILLQYTGLHDKNGVEIYEGDILRYVSPPEYDDGSGEDELYCVEWASFGFEATWHHPHRPNATSDGHLALQSCDKDMEIIGNIYENPELLEAL